MDIPEALAIILRMVQIYDRLLRTNCGRGLTEEELAAIAMVESRCR